MKTAVIYQSRYGFTERYANWLAEELGADLIQAQRVRDADIQRYETIVYGGGLYAGSVNGISFLTQYKEPLLDKTLYLFTVGASDNTDSENMNAIRNSLAQKLPPALFSKLHLYHLRGGLCYSKMSLLHRLMMGMMIKMLQKKPEWELRSDERDMLRCKNQDADFTDRATIAPLVADIKAGT